MGRLIRGSHWGLASIADQVARATPIRRKSWDPRSSMPVAGIDALTAQTTLFALQQVGALCLRTYPAHPVTRCPRPW